MSKIKNRKKADLVDFQNKLNEQFLEIDNSSADLNFSDSGVVSGVSDLGLMTIVDGRQWFIPLKDLRHVMPQSNFEQIFISKPWIAGFVHSRGDVYTVIDWLLFLSGQKTQMTKDAALVMFKDVGDMKISWLIDNMNLEYTAEYTKLYVYDHESDLWHCNEDVEDIMLFVKKDNCTQKEMEWIQNISSGEHRSLLSDDKINYVRNVYLDALGKRPIFEIDINRFVEFLSVTKPY